MSDTGPGHRPPGRDHTHHGHLTAPPESSSWLPLAPDVALLGVSLAAGLGMTRLTQAPWSARIVGPVVATVVAAQVATGVTRRLRAPVAAVSASGLAAVVLATVWGPLLSATRFGLPTPTTWRVFVDRLDTAGSAIRSNPTPVPVNDGVVLCMALGAGIAAVLAGALWAHDQRRTSGGPTHGPRPLAALIPSFGLLCYTALLSSQVDRVQGVVAYLVAALAFVAVADRPARGQQAAGAAARPVWRRAAGQAAGLLPAVGGGALAVVVLLAASPGLSGLRVSALPFPDQRGRAGAGLGGGLGGAGGFGGGIGGFNFGGAGLADVPGVRAIDLVDDLQAVLTNRTTELMFSAVTPVPTYWQVAVLTRFDGRAWAPDPTTLAAVNNTTLALSGTALPGLPALLEPTPRATYRTDITVAALQSTLLPLPPTAVSVGGANATLVPGFGAVQPYEAPPSFTYQAVARLPTGSSRTATNAVPAGGGETVDRASLAPYLQLPAVSRPVLRLAHQIVAGSHTPATQAAALARWFDSGRFRYTLSPPTVRGADPLSSFLFTTRAGFCQQFAAAYAVLARIDGLPARVAVGFTTGSPVRGGRYNITGADAHVWPEVYLGPSAGWTSFEPTPASSGEPNGIGVITGGRSGGARAGSQGNTQTTVVLPARRPAPFGTLPPSSVKVAPLRLGARPAPSPSLASAAVVTPLVIAGGVVVGVGAVRWLWLRQRRRPRSPRRGRASDPTSQVLGQWLHAQSSLERARLGRLPAETLHEHASRLESLAGARWLASFDAAALAFRAQAAGDGPPSCERTVGPDPIQDAVDAYRRLADLATRASYAPDPCTPGDAADAAQLCAVVRTGLARRGGRRLGPLSH